MKIIQSFRIEKELVDKLEKRVSFGFESKTDIVENALRKYLKNQPEHVV